MQNQILTCVIVDDEIGNTVVLSHYVSQIPYLNLKMVFQKPTEALAYLLKNPTDLLITDIVMPELSGIGLYECLITEVNTQVIFVSGYVDKLVESLKYSVVDYLQKPVGQKRFEEATQKALKTLPIVQVSHSDIPKEVLDKAVEGYSTLSPAQHRVFEHIADGKTTKQIADIICNAEGTISLHRHSIREKLHIPSTIELKDIAVYLIKKLGLGNNTKI